MQSTDYWELEFKQYGATVVEVRRERTNFEGIQADADIVHPLPPLPDYLVESLVANAMQNKAQKDCEEGFPRNGTPNI